MQFTMTTPCPKCPFRTDIKPFLHKGGAREITEMLLRRDGTFQCHATVDYTKANDEGVVDHLVAASEPRAQHCAGAMIVLEKMNRPNQMMRICERIGRYDRSKLEMTAPMFATMSEFVKAQR